jgi:hypothetical protein
LASFLLGYVRRFSQGFGEFKDDLLTSFSAYVQDDYHVSRRLTLNLGLRWDPFVPWRETRGRMEQFNLSDYYAGRRSQVYVNAPPGLWFPGDSGMPDSGQYPSYNNFAPRLGFAYDVFGDGKTSIRGGTGVFYDALESNTMTNRFVDLTPFSPQLALTQPKGTFSNPYLGIVNPYPSPFPPPKDSAFPAPVLALTFDPANGAKAMTPVVYNWNLILERQVTRDWIVRAGYIASHSSRLPEWVELNPAVYIPGSRLSTDERRALQPYGNITQVSRDINSSFNSLQLTTQKRLSHGLSFLANYTWSKSIDDAPQGQGISGPLAANCSPVPWSAPGRHQYDRGLSDFDHAHRVVVSYVYDLPKLAASGRIARVLVGGWQWTGIFTYLIGGPITIIAGRDQTQTGIGSDRANYLGGNPIGPGACGNTVRCVDYLVRSTFGLPATGTFGNVGKGMLRGPNLMNWDLGIFKEFPLYGDRYRFQVRGEFFNAPNRANFSNPNVTQSSTGFGTITGASDPRIGQLALKLLF